MADGESLAGNCFLCGAELGIIAMKKHVLKAHTLGVSDRWREEGGLSADAQSAVLLKVEGWGDQKYWLYLDVAATATLSSLDRFLRKIWLECCGHLSFFYTQKEYSVGKAQKICNFTPGMKLIYRYDMGSTTELSISFLADVSRPAQKNAVRLLARNVPPVVKCADCGKPAVYESFDNCYEEWKPACYCADCAQSHKPLSGLPITNSPRSGVCAYDGALDCFAFNMRKAEE
jgi:hypothetical protein